MTRIKRGVTKKRRHKKMLKMTKGHVGVRHTLYRRAHESMIHALQYSYAHRKEKKGDMRRLWNIRINAAARINGTTYSKFEPFVGQITPKGGENKTRKPEDRAFLSALAGLVTGGLLLGLLLGWRRSRKPKAHFAATDLEAAELLRGRKKLR